MRRKLISEYLAKLSVLILATVTQFHDIFTWSP